MCSSSDSFHIGQGSGLTARGHAPKIRAPWKQAGSLPPVALSDTPALRDGFRGTRQLFLLNPH